MPLKVPSRLRQSLTMIDILKRGSAAIFHANPKFVFAQIGAKVSDNIWMSAARHVAHVQHTFGGHKSQKCKCACLESLKNQICTVDKSQKSYSYSWKVSKFKFAYFKITKNQISTVGESLKFNLTVHSCDLDMGDVPAVFHHKNFLLNNSKIVTRFQFYHFNGGKFVNFVLT